MPLLTTSLDQVTYEQVIDFCASFPEGVRVEYKREPVNIPKVVASFANTVGGVWVIGVDADKVTNLPQLPALGLKKRPGIEEQITQSAQSGVYPSVAPAVRVFDIPDKPDHVLVVVKVSESVEAPHAIENSTRVWVRNASTTEPYELADIERIDYLLQRRRTAEQRREELILASVARSALRQQPRRARAIIAPVYPRGITLSHDALFERADLLERQGSRFLRDFRLIHQAVAAQETTAKARPFYFEMSVHGVGLMEQLMTPAGRAGNVDFVYLGNLLHPVAATLNLAVSLLRGAVTNLLIRYELLNCEGLAFLPFDYSRLSFPEDTAIGHRLVDNAVSVSTTAVVDGIAEKRVAILTELARQLLWAFNHRDPDLSTTVDSALKNIGAA